MRVHFRWTTAYFIALLLLQVPAIEADQPTSVSPSTQGTSIAAQLWVLGDW